MSSSSSSNHHHNFFFDLNRSHRRANPRTPPREPANNVRINDDAGNLNFNNLSNSNLDSEDTFEIRFSDIHFEQWYIETLINLSCISFAGALICAGLLWKVSYYFVLLELIAFDFLNVTVLYKKWRNEKNYLMRRRVYVFIIEQIIGFICKLIIFLYLENEMIPLIYIMIPLGIYFLIRCLFYSCERTSGDCNSVFDFMTIGFRIFIFIQGITLSLKINSFLTWEWKEIFWTYWVFFSILVGVNFGMFLMTSSKFCQGLFGEIDFSELKGIFWFLLLSTDFTSGSCLFVLGLIDFLDQGKNEKLTICFYYSLISWVLIFLISLLLRRDILKFFRTLNINENEIVDREGSVININNKTDKPNPPAKKEPLIIPKFLMKFSSTYFKRANDNNVQNQKNEKSERKEKITEKTDINYKDTNNLRKKFHKQHGRSNSEIDYDKVSKMMSGGSSIYELINNRIVTDHTTQNVTQVAFTNENCAITIPTEIDEEQGKNKIKARFSQSPVEIINFFNNNDSNKPNINNNFLQILHEEEVRKTLSARGTNKSTLSNVPKNLAPFFPSSSDEKDKNIISQDELGVFHTRSKSLQIVPLLNESYHKYINGAGDTLQVQYSPSSHEKKVPVNEEKPLENLDRSVVNCLICFDKTPDAVFMECGHGGVCYECSLELWKNTGECFLCRHVELTT